MAQKRRSAEQIIRLLKRVDVLPGQVKAVELTCRGLGISDATYYKWRKQYGGMGVYQSRWLRELEAETFKKVQNFSRL